MTGAPRSERGSSSHAEVLVVGGGLAGCEAAFQLALRGVAVELVEMRPVRQSPAHETDRLAELVCSNSLRGAELTHAVGLLKEEARRTGSLILEAADATRIPAGRAQAVDRRRFAEHVTERLVAHPLVKVTRQEVTEVPRGRDAIVATGPLSSEAMASDLARLTGSEGLHYYDAIAPVLDAESLDRSRVFAASRYEDGEGDYLNVPLDEAQYGALVSDLLTAEQVEPRPFEEARYFEGCLPVEVLASRGEETLAFGPLKPVGLVDPRTGRRPHAVVQLRKEDEDGTAYNLVGFQTRMRQAAQLRVIRSLPGLEGARLLRHGSIHRNTFVDAPRVLGSRLELRAAPEVLLAGQVTGVEGYVESAACGLLAGLFMAGRRLEIDVAAPPRTTALGGLLWHLGGGAGGRFQPSNLTWALLPAAPKRRRRAERRRAAAERALSDLAPWIESLPQNSPSSPPRA